MVNGMRIDDLTRNQIRTTYLTEDITLEDIADRFKCNVGTVSNILREKKIYKKDQKEYLSEQKKKSNGGKKDEKKSKKEMVPFTTPAKTTRYPDDVIVNLNERTEFTINLIKKDYYNNSGTNNNFIFESKDVSAMTDFELVEMMISDYIEKAVVVNGETKYNLKVIIDNIYPTEVISTSVACLTKVCAEKCINLTLIHSTKGKFTTQVIFSRFGETNSSLKRIFPQVNRVIFHEGTYDTVLNSSNKFVMIKTIRQKNLLGNKETDITLDIFESINKGFDFFCGQMINQKYSKDYIYSNIEKGHISPNNQYVKDSFHMAFTNCEQKKNNSREDY